MAMGIGGFPQKSVMEHKFSQVPQAEIERSAFKRDHGYKTTFDAGWLIPIYADEALPGDTFKVTLSSIARFTAALGLPIMDNLYMDFFFFAVPNRLVWTNFQKFMGEQENPDDSTDYRVPQIDLGAGESVAVGSLADYMGIPIGVNNIKFNSLHFRAYNLIWNEWFRDQNLQNSVPVDKDDGPDNMSDYVLLRRGKRHDYFTSCLPWPQKGVAVELPLGSVAPVIPYATDRVWPAGGEPAMRMWKIGDGSYSAVAKGLSIEANTGKVRADDVDTQIAEEYAPSNLYTDLSTATAATINELRQAFQLQRLMERDARGGTRYTEIIRSHFRVISPDARLQRPEYLGGGSTRVVVDPVPNTGGFTGTFVGKLGATGYCNQHGVGFTKSFVEHSVILGLAMVRADLTYQTGLNRMWSRQTKYDFYWPALAHLGEQAVLNKEIYINNDVHDDEVFGYQERWAEYRYHPSLITGKLRSNAVTSLDAWHLSQDFNSLPVLVADPIVLNEGFIVEDPPIHRIMTVTTQPAFVFDGYFDVTCTRPMPTYSVPGLIDHF